MITGELKNKVDSIWDTIWTGGITSPITVLEQITYLMFMKLLDDNQLKAEANANVLGVPLKNKVFPEGVCIISENPRVETDYNNLRWNVFHNFEPGEMLTNIQTYVFPFIKTIGEGKDTAFSRYMKDTVFLIPTAKVLAKVVDGIDAMDMNNKDIMGDVYEYLLGKIAAAGENGQFRTPRHIINMMVQLMRPTLKDKILDPAMGSAGFLLASAAYIGEHQKKDLMKRENLSYFKAELFSGFDTDQSMLRIGAMNMMLHGVEDPHIIYQDSLSGDNTERDVYTLIMSNPPFTGSVFQEEISNVWFMYIQFELSKKAIQSSINMALKGILSKRQLSEMKFIFPPIELQNEYGHFAAQIDKSKLTIQQSIFNCGEFKRTN